MRRGGKFNWHLALVVVADALAWVAIGLAVRLLLRSLS
jgi:hypothetical protein